jgi:hypothetical protein
VRLAVANLVAAGFLAGLVWIVQVVHYPLFADVPADAWPAYEAEHQERITLVAGPSILASVALAVALLGAPGPRRLVLANLGLAGFGLIVTGLVFAPLHGELAEGFDAGRIDLLVGLNWIRTAAWTAQAAVAAALVLRLVAARPAGTA